MRGIYSAICGEVNVSVSGGYVLHIDYTEKMEKLFYFCHLKELVRTENFGPYQVGFTCKFTFFYYNKITRLEFHSFYSLFSMRHQDSGEHPISLQQRFSNFFQVGTTFISQNVIRTTLLLGLSNSLGLP